MCGICKEFTACNNFCLSPHLFKTPSKTIGNVLTFPYSAYLLKPGQGLLVMTSPASDLLNMEIKATCWARKTNRQYRHYMSSPCMLNHIIFPYIYIILNFISFSVSKVVSEPWPRGPKPVWSPRVQIYLMLACHPAFPDKITSQPTPPDYLLP